MVSDERLGQRWVAMFDTAVFLGSSPDIRKGVAYLTPSDALARQKLGQRPCFVFRDLHWF
jgi:hypothetical protein